MKFSITSFLIYAMSAAKSFDIGSKLTGGEGYEYETKETRVSVDFSTDCDSCKVYGGIGALLDGKPSTKFTVEAISDVDIASSTIVINVDVRYNTRKTHLNHFSITSSDDISFDPLEVGMQARDEVEGSWESIHVESDLVWADREEKKQIMFNNYNSFFEYRLTLKKKANTNKVEISDYDIISKILSTLAAETYYKLTGIQLFSPSTVQPKGTFMIGMVINPSKNFMVSLNILPLGKVDNWSNIYRFRDDPKGTSNYETLGDRQPCLNFLPNSYELEASIVDKTGYKQYRHGKDSLTEKVESTVVTKVLGDVMKLYVDGQVVGSAATKFSDRPDYTILYAFASDNIGLPANVVVKGLRFINLKNDSLVPEPTTSPTNNPTDEPTTPTAHCVDTAGWDNGYHNHNCDSYAVKGWCANGAAKPGQEWTLGATYNYPELHCCVCGK